MVQTLQWDSDFFSMRIGKIDIAPNDFLDVYRKLTEASDYYDLIYVFVKKALQHRPKNVNLVDVKKVYAKFLSEVPVISDQVSIYTDTIPNDDLYRLALISGTCSRYNLDKQLPINSYERLYKRWIEQSVNGYMADKVLVHRSNRQIDGMVTVRIKDGIASIGLIAVDKQIQGKGIGLKLINAVEHFLLTKTSVRILEVATQLNNVGACNFYKKCGFKIENEMYVYHWWL